MKQYAIALVLAAVLGVPAFAQPPLAFGPPPPTPHQAVLPGPTPSPGPPVPNTGVYGFYKSGGVLVGSNGYFPYDTGVYLLGGTDGLARSMGYYTMMPRAPSGSPTAPPAVSGSCGSCSRFFRR
ncbi:MAG: hypothetical protein K8U57_35020 [Planctomycetes bacterium]|nr:hypothetical protein [Planctomycetota bacterium]